MQDLPHGYTARPLTIADAEAVAAICAAEEIADLGRIESHLEELLGDWQRPSVDLSQSTVGVLSAGELSAGELIAYGELDDSHAYAAVHPEHRRKGVGTWVAGWLETRAGERGATEVSGQVLRGSPGDRLLVGRGYVERWAAWDLVLPEGAEIAAQPLPPGYVLRSAEPADHEAVWTVFEDAFLEWSDRDRRPLEDFASMVWNRPGFEPWNLRVVTDPAGAVVGAVHVVLTGDTGNVPRVAVRADQRNRGLARALLAEAFALARRHGAVRSLLSTDSRTGALGLYERVGMVVESEWVNRAIDL